MQIYISDDYGEDENKSVFIRSGFQTLTNKGWNRVSHNIPSFYKSYSDLPSLASALGVLVNSRTPDSGEIDMDANNCDSTGFYYIKTSGSIPYTDIHLPTSSNIVIFVFSTGNLYLLQMGVEQTGKLFYRVLTDRTSTWTTWKEL